MNLKKILIFICLLCFMLSGCGKTNEQSVTTTQTTEMVQNDNSAYPKPKLTIANIDTNGITVNFRAAQGYFYNADSNLWNFKYIKGVNMGLTEATTSLDNPNVSYETYMQWFEQISAMNANTVKVFTEMPPQFYKALYDFNSNSSNNKLYLIQGIWFNEDLMYNLDNVYDNGEQIVTSFEKAILETVDIVHGNCSGIGYGEIENAVYEYDIHKYVAGYVLGLEWDSGFVIRTNELSNKGMYSGEYLSAATDATVFESFLASMGDKLISYETNEYNAQTPVAFLNWSTTDSITHDNEPFPEEDAVSVNTENITSSSSYYAGLFAAIDVYPYYPEFMNYQPEYINYTDENGNSDSYRAYLSDLINSYSVPVIIAEFGVPTSRGIAHTSVSSMNQGGITEEQQGEYVSNMLKSIAKEGYAGSAIFSWQDEWFKQTWNTIKYSPDNPSQRTPNLQSAEQSYGILAMEPGIADVCLIDGETDDWNNCSPVSAQQGIAVYAKWDEGYLYLRVDCENLNFSQNEIFVPISISNLGSNFSNDYDLSFNKNADFLLVINGEKNTRLLCDSYQDIFEFTYVVQKQAVQGDGETVKRNSGEYNKIYQFLSNEIVLPLSGEVIEPKYYESGLLTYGISDPDSDDYNSLADFYCKNNTIEIRLPWYLLNVANSTNGTRLGDFYNDGDVTFSTISQICVGAGEKGTSINLDTINYTTKSTSEFHTRLKKSYDVIQKTMESLMAF